MFFSTHSLASVFPQDGVFLSIIYKPLFGDVSLIIIVKGMGFTIGDKKLHQFFIWQNEARCSYAIGILTRKPNFYVILRS
jgi:hypothetical protein